MSNVADRLAKSNARAAATSKQVRLRLVYIDFWSALKLAFLVTITGAIVMLVGVALIWQILNIMGVVTSLTGFLGSLLGAADQISYWLQFGPIMLFTFVASALLVVVGSVLGAVGALLYNVSVKLTGGLLVGFTNN